MAQNNNKDTSKRMEYAKRQQQLRDLGASLNHGHSKMISADSMIEDLLSKKETFQKRNPDVSQTVGPPSWLSAGVPLYERVWAGVQTAGGLADTPLLSSLLISSGLSTDTLGYIWSLANHTVPGALTQQELYSVLAIVGLAQTGYVVNNISALHQLPQAPLPSLDLALLPTRTVAPQLYPSPLNVTSLPEPSTFSWSSSDTVRTDSTDKIGVSYVSAGPMVSPNLLAEHSSNLSNFTNTNCSQDTKVSHLKSGEHAKHSGGTLQISFPKLNESPSHVIEANPVDNDPFDDEFTDFQSADFTSISISNSHDFNSKPDNDNKDEFLDFQKAPSDVESDDLSVLVIDGKNTTSAQQLWVTDALAGGKELFTNVEPKPSKTPSCTFADTKYFTSVSKEDKNKSSKYDVFNNIDDDKLSIFHNPLPEDEDRLSNASGNAGETSQAAPKSIFNHSLFNDPDISLDLFGNSNAPTVDSKNLDLDKQAEWDLATHALKVVDDDDDDFANFQTFSDSNAEKVDHNSIDDAVDKYNVFRTIVFEDTASLSLDRLSNPEITIKSDDNLSNFELTNQGDHNEIAGNLFDDKKHSGGMMSQDLSFGDFQESSVLPQTNSSKIDDLFSSLSISEKVYEKEVREDIQSTVKHVEDKYKALRLLETDAVETDDFGEFLGAELPGSGSNPVDHSSKKSVQIRVLEECLNILKEGVENMSKLNGLSPEEIPDVFKEPRVKFYLDCLMEIHRVSEYIICNMEGDTSAHIFELKNIWKCLSPYYVYSEHNLLPETNGAVCGICRSSTGPSPITLGGQTFHAPCANLYLHCIEPVLPNIASTTVQ